MNKTISKDTEINEDEQTKKVYANRINLEFPIDSEQMQLLKENDKAQFGVIQTGIDFKKPNATKSVPENKQEEQK